MKILSKQKDALNIIAFPSEIDVDKGEYLLIDESDGAMLCQVLDVDYADIPGILEDMLREASLDLIKHGNVFDPFNAGSFSLMIREARLIKVKIRCIIDKGSKIVKFNSSWLPSRFKSKIVKADIETLLSVMNLNGKRKIFLGEVAGKSFWVDAESFDGRLTIVTGKKETGKSHITKLISTSLVEHGASVIILDVNGEYVNLHKNVDGSYNFLVGRHVVLEPGTNFVVRTEEVGLRTFLDILTYVYDTPPNSCREFFRVWNAVKKAYGKVTLRGLMDAIQRMYIHESIKDALLARLMAIESTNFLSDDPSKTLDIEELLNLDIGSMIIVNLRDLLPSTRRMVVEFLLSKLTELLHQRRIPPLFLVAEEAHLYLRDTYWDDIVTRMRHLGLSPIFVTNQPDSIPETIYRQADNIILFNFTNESDLDAISKTSRVDTESVKMIVPYLPPRYCLLIGYLVKDLPIVLKVRSLDMMTMGTTRQFFKLIDSSNSSLVHT